MHVTVLRIVAFCFALVSLAVGALAQDYPNRLITIVVANTAGNPADFMPRILAPEMSKILGQPIVVENRLGAGSLIGFEYVARQVPADGYTLLSANPNNLAIFPLVTKDLRFDPLTELPPDISVAEGRLFLVSPATSPWRDFAEFV